MSSVNPGTIREWLARGGWHPDRDIGARADELIRVAVDAAAQQGMELAVPDAAVRFIRSYGELELVIPGTSPEALLMLDPTIGYDGDVEDFAELGELLQRQLFPVGAETCEFGTWLIDDMGRFFYRHHTGNFYLGATADEAFAAILSGGLLPYAEEASSAVTAYLGSPTQE
ncbi:SUKH-3 domain-containing protein [Nocardia concava]|uniref:SUKH-3 domain-containing protein n=1 Tax=Nocardia concava TaxID=257281 RepID=UPI0006862E2C|nr:SUKH-3 domain-containing protein [Nocardia concava]